MRVFYRKNLASTEVEICDDLTSRTPTAWPEYATKQARNAHWAQPTTQGMFYSGFEGVSGSVVCGSATSNAVLKLHTLVVDYDAKVGVTPEELAQQYLNTPHGPYRPAWGCITHSGNLRLLWVLERPLTVASPAQLKALLVAITRHLALIKWHGGFDATAFANATQYYEFGRQWFPIAPDDVIPFGPMLSWAWAATKTVQALRTEERIQVPLEVALKEIKHRWGEEAWTGPFEVGARGRRFWDPSADNETAVWLRPDGFVCFTGNIPFVSWRALFGDPFIDQLDGARIQSVYDRVVWDEQNYWVELPDGRGWEKYSSPQLREWMQVQGFSNKVPKGAEVSEVAQMCQHILANGRVRGVLPFLYRPHGIYVYKGERVLNISRLRVMDPAARGAFTDLEDAKTRCFPFIWSFLSNFLAPVDGAPIQFRYLLCWMKHFYEHAYYQNPHPGHAVVLAGPTGRGKTFFAQSLLGRLMGGSHDASDFMIRGSQWTDKLVRSPIALIDDQQGSTSFETHAQFSAVVKKFVANQTLTYNGKWKDTGEVEWNGRVIICCNDDPESIKLLPHMDNSIKDKISMLKVSEERFMFPEDRNETAARLAQELPFFARFLLDMAYPDDIINTEDTRFFLTPFRHPELMAYASRGTQTYAIFELLGQFLDNWKTNPARTNDTHWEGTATTLYQDMCGGFVAPDLLRRLTPRHLGTALGQLKSKGAKVEVVEGKRRGMQTWRIPLDMSWELLTNDK